MGRKSYICNGHKGTTANPTPGMATPNGNKRGCLCPDKDTYSRDCCKRLLINQGIGNIDYIPSDVPARAFSNAFSKAFA